MGIIKLAIQRPTAVLSVVFMFVLGGVVALNEKRAPEFRKYVK